MKKYLSIVGLVLGLLTSCAGDNEPPKPKEEDSYQWRVEMVADMGEIKEAAVRLKDNESVDINLKYLIHVNFSPDLSGMEENLNINVTGRLTKCGLKKTLWEHGVGQNRVPAKLCGKYTFSDLYEISCSLFMNIPGIKYQSVAKDGVGWSPLTLNNPQTPYQFNRGTDIEPEFVTYIYDIRSSENESPIPTNHLWLPFQKDNQQIKLYGDITFPES